MAKAPAATGSLRERLLKNSTIKETDLMSESKIFDNVEQIPTDVPMINIALSGSIDGGISPGLMLAAGPSKHFKSGFALLMASAFAKYHTKKGEDYVILFYDSEFGSPESYFNRFNIPMENVVHTPITDIEELKHDLMIQLEGITVKDNVFILIDSVGNLASKKEVDDALEGKSVADMTRAKQFKSLWRMVTPHLTLKRIPVIAIAHTYETMEMYSKQVVSGGVGQYYAANTIWILGRRQAKDGTELTGYDFVINIEKSRSVREKSVIPISVRFEEGISKWSGMWDLAEEMGYIAKVTGTRSKYAYVDLSTGEIDTNKDNYFEKDDVEENGDLFYDGLFNKGMKKAIEKRYKLA